MLSFIKKVLIVLLNFSGYLTTKCVLLNDGQCMVRPTLIDLNLVEFNYYSFMVSLDKCSGSCNSGNDFSAKIFVPSKSKDIKVKVLIKHISCDCKCKFNSTTGDSNQKWNNKTCQCECKYYRKHK